MKEIRGRITYEGVVTLVTSLLLDSSESFVDWDLCDENGWTVAHEMASRGHLPKSFSQWGLCDNFAWSVAHQAAYSGNLPANFHKDFPDGWILEDNAGHSVKEWAIQYGYVITE